MFPVSNHRQDYYKIKIALPDVTKVQFLIVITYLYTIERILLGHGHMVYKDPAHPNRASDRVRKKGILCSKLSDFFLSYSNLTLFYQVSEEKNHFYAVQQRTRA